MGPHSGSWDRIAVSRQPGQDAVHRECAHESASDNLDLAPYCTIVKKRCARTSNANTRSSTSSSSSSSSTTTSRSSSCSSSTSSSRTISRSTTTSSAPSLPLGRDSRHPPRCSAAVPATTLRPAARWRPLPALHWPLYFQLHSYSTGPHWLQRLHRGRQTGAPTWRLLGSLLGSHTPRQHVPFLHSFASAPTLPRVWALGRKRQSVGAKNAYARRFYGYLTTESTSSFAAAATACHRRMGAGATSSAAADTEPERKFKWASETLLAFSVRFGGRWSRGAKTFRKRRPKTLRKRKCQSGQNGTKTKPKRRPKRGEHEARTKPTRKTSIEYGNLLIELINKEPFRQRLWTLGLGLARGGHNHELQWRCAKRDQHVLKTY